MFHFIFFTTFYPIDLSFNLFNFFCNQYPNQYLWKKKKVILEKERKKEEEKFYKITLKTLTKQFEKLFFASDILVEYLSRHTKKKCFLPFQTSFYLFLLFFPLPRSAQIFLFLYRLSIRCSIYCCFFTPIKTFNSKLAVDYLSFVVLRFILIGARYKMFMLIVYHKTGENRNWLRMECERERKRMNFKLLLSKCAKYTFIAIRKKRGKKFKSISFFPIFTHGSGLKFPQNWIYIDGRKSEWEKKREKIFLPPFITWYFSKWNSFMIFLIFFFLFLFLSPSFFRYFKAIPYYWFLNEIFFFFPLSSLLLAITFLSF